MTILTNTTSTNNISILSSMSSHLKLASEKETQRIISFLKKTFTQEHIQSAVIGISGGIDSATSLFLLSKSLPQEHIFPIHLYYFHPEKQEIEELVKTANIPLKNLSFTSIKKSADTLAKELQNKNDKIRFGNIMARTR